MNKFVTGLLTLAMYAASLPVIAMITPAQAATKKHWRPSVSDVGQAQAFVPPYSQAGPICPGIARGIDCKVWPPPIDEDPDRKRGASGADAARKGRLVMKRLQKITFAELRAQGVYGVYCQDYRCSQSIKVSADPWPDHDDEPPVQFALSPARPSFSNRGAAPMPWPRPNPAK